jgi:hypothetical protein
VYVIAECPRTFILVVIWPPGSNSLGRVLLSAVTDRLRNGGEDLCWRRGQTTDMAWGGKWARQGFMVGRQRCGGVR